MVMARVSLRFEVGVGVRIDDSGRGRINAKRLGSKLGLGLGV